jgi:hypothetical protein
MKFLWHLKENPFITLTGFAALVHSTWSLGTMFSGNAPATSDWLAYAGWVLPAFFVAFAMDVGQISTSAEIRHEGLTWQRGLTFSMFCIATYYLQFLYIAHHMPPLDVALGVSAVHQPSVVTARDAAIWILPLFLPLTTMLYTISGGRKKEKAIAPARKSDENIIIEKRKNEELPAPANKEQPEEHNDFDITILNLENPLLFDETEEESSNVAPLLSEQPRLAEWRIASFISECECGRQFKGETQEQADRALRAHRVHCKKEVGNATSD